MDTFLEINLDIDDNDLAALVTELQTNTVIKKLMLEGRTTCTVTIVRWKAFFEMLQINETIQRLDIVECNFDIDCCSLFAKMVLCKYNVLQELGFSSNTFGWNGVNVMVDALCANGCTLQSLSFYDELTSENSDINMETETSKAKKFVTLLQQPGSCLKSLSLSSNTLGDEFVSELANGLKKGSKLEKLSLFGNCIGVEGAEKLADALYFNTTLVELNLMANNMEDDGTNAITTALRYHPTLKLLSIFHNNLTQDGLIKTRQFLQYNDVLQSFISRNPLLEEDVLPLLSILDHNDTLLNATFHIHFENHLHDGMENAVEIVPLLEQNKNGQRTAPKKGLRRRQQFYTWLEDDWICTKESKKIVNKSDHKDEDIPMVVAVHDGNNQDKNVDDLEEA